MLLRLPQDVFQTVKISKLLILMDKVRGHKYKGKSLNEIDIDPNEELVESENSEEENLENVPIPTSDLELLEPSTSRAVSSTTKGRLVF